ncbi:CubicO group peptidase, beta-lactamase class C family [Mucilaginibacter mallensis]|uniref:CubicO group peptidase, beta-lactamase class C family n=1 Tax=Mucilaginibacter mallensis TaxID=652787 RepID=A0A1H1UCV9_MUCMA|nr:serine hydrolase [Mucilaginibacter mallensis]SDS70342.1 CubicO group peptidase, beta-lactamase class C family [Mucilaginibacter mallensis]
MRSIRLSLILASLLFLQFKTRAQTVDPAIADKISRVENNILKPIQIEGDAPYSIQQDMKDNHIHGVSIAVIHNYKIEWAKGYGYADDSLKIPVTAQTLFQAASISKSLNAVGVLKLVQDKKLDLYADINNYLTTWKFPYDSLSKNKKISVANLLSHTAGLTVHGFGGYSATDTLPTLVQILNGTKPANSPAIRSMYAPGLKSEYSGGGITISQMIVMDITHESYDKYMYDNVLKPLGMTSSTYTQPPVNVKPALLAAGYRPDGKEIPGKFHTYPEQAAAGLWTNPTDLAKYIIETQLAYHGKSSKVLNQQMTQLRLTPYIDNEAALGTFVINRDSTKYFSHSGANEGFRCAYYGSFEDGNGVVVMVNSDNGNINNDIVNSVAKVYGFKGLNISVTRKVIKVDDAILQSYTGKYAISSKQVAIVAKQGSQLTIQMGNQRPLNVYPETKNKFFVKEFNAEAEFITDDKGQVTKVIFYENGHSNEALPVK